MLLGSLSLLVLHSSTPASAGCDTDTDTTLKVVTLNTWGLPEPIAHDRRGRMPRIERWLDDSGVDVAGLQEVWRGALKLLRRPLHLDDSMGDTGLALRSRHPLGEPSVQTFRAERGVDRFKAKGVLTAEASVDGQPVQLAVTHLQSGGGSRNADVRAQQVDEILGAVGEPGVPLVLMGDFNFYDGQRIDQSTHARLLDAGFMDVAGSVGETRGTYVGLNHRFDRVYVRSRCAVPIAAEVVTDEDLSDHRPVVVELSL